MKWVLGFAFDHYGRVALIHKRDKEGVPQRGMWNGLGGGVLQGESVRGAMRREFREESGVDIEDHHWHRLGILIGKDWSCDMFVANDPSVQFACKQTDEDVRLYALHELPSLNCGDNVLALIMLASLPAAQRPTVNLIYKD